MCRLSLWVVAGVDARLWLRSWLWVVGVGVSVSVSVRVRGCVRAGAGVGGVSPSVEQNLVQSPPRALSISPYKC